MRLSRFKDKMYIKGLFVRKVHKKCDGMAFTVEGNNISLQSTQKQSKQTQNLTIYPLAGPEPAM